MNTDMGKDKCNSSWKSIKDRWQATSPLIFRRICNICVGISTVAVAVQTALVAAGANTPQWWTDLFPYLVGIPAGMAAVAKLTKEDKSNEND